MLEPGDLAVIIESALGVNVGRIVQCINIVGTHSQYGPVWNVSSKEPIISEYGAHGHQVHVPQKWLKKIEPGALDKSTQKTKELTI
ncbi:hypothetical protein UFOVP116_286 [uncultured Caudovirales phage]|uniref:Uncharacterized protein n=1 Tax=uncultured Caudovirales phage TaxID=2100421 RepID=A0A6J5LA11_9CAUD|nr:hypothetical protein UFOVP116_286 [uncultured Caudovirales phage]